MMPNYRLEFDEIYESDISEDRTLEGERRYVVAAPDSDAARTLGETLRRKIQLGLGSHLGQLRFVLETPEPAEAILGWQGETIYDPHNAPIT